MTESPRPTARLTIVVAFAMASMAGCGDDPHPVHGGWVEKESAPRPAHVAEKGLLPSQSAIIFQPNGRFTYRFPVMHPYYRFFSQLALGEGEYGPDGHRYQIHDGALIWEGRYEVVDEKTLGICAPSAPEDGEPGTECNPALSVQWQLFFSGDELRIEQTSAMSRELGLEGDEESLLGTIVKSLPTLAGPWLTKSAGIPPVDGVVFVRAEQDDLRPVKTRATAGSPTSGYVASDSASVRSAPVADAPERWRLNRGHRVRLLVERDGWRQIVIPDQRDRHGNVARGWVSAASVASD